ncbi:MAG: nucleotide exchange factor GrpE [Defluviitaleaceae bacterium]|nr:nucleotide exchange factor GrpE [Defluviitaleaceae bacterium]
MKKKDKIETLENQPIEELQTDQEQSEQAVEDVIPEPSVEELLNDAEERYLRVMAEFDNFRKRSDAEKLRRYDDGIASAVIKFLPVIDNFERAMAAMSVSLGEDDVAAKGFDMILRQMREILQGMGVTEIPAAGEAFDPNIHAAVMMEESQEHEAGIVIEELMKGYIYKDRPLRHSMVKVSN